MNPLETLEHQLEQIQDLPTLPFIYTRLSQALEDPDATAQGVAEILADDQALCSKVLRVVNSAFYGFPRKIGSISQAVAVLGFEAVKNLSLATSVLDLFRDRLDGDLDQTEFWRHAIRCAVASKTLGKAIRYPQVEELFVAGLLHDVGKLVEYLFFREGFLQAHRQAREAHQALFEAEEAYLGFHHALVGYLLLRHWNLPPVIQEVCRTHHLSAPSGEYAREVAVVQVGNALAHALAVAEGAQDRVPPVRDATWSLLGLPVEYLSTLMEATQEESQDIFALFLEEG